MEKEIETKLDSDDHPPWLCMERQHLLYLRAMSQENTSKPVQLEKDGEIIRLKTMKEAACFLGMKENTFNSRVKFGHDCNGWKVTYIKSEKED